MNLQDFNFPKLTDLDIAFSTLKTDKILLEEAKNRGFYNGNTEYNKLFKLLFYKGSTLYFKDDLNKEFRIKCFSYLSAFIGSFEPKHEEKEAICAMLLSELVDIKKYKKVLKQKCY